MAVMSDSPGSQFIRGIRDTGKRDADPVEMRQIRAQEFGDCVVDEEEHESHRVDGAPEEVDVVLFFCC